MYLVTRVVRETNPNQNTGELENTVVENVAAIMNDQQSKLLRRRIANDDHRVMGSRIFQLEVTDDGTPTIGAELGWHEAAEPAPLTPVA